MKDKYKKYYDVLKGKDYTSYAQKYLTSINEVETKINSAEATISSSRWTEKGVEIIKSRVLPSLKNQVDSIKSGLDALNNACSKVKDLVSKLEVLETACKSLSEAEARRAALPEEERASESLYLYEKRVTTAESEVESAISAVNGIGVNIIVRASEFGADMVKLKEATSLAALKAEFLGTMNDSSWTLDHSYDKKAKEIMVFDNTTGKIIKEGGELNLKVGETRVLTVRLPHNYGRVKRLIRTTADGNGAYRSGSIIRAKSDIDPDPNRIEFVNEYPWSNHIPANRNLQYTHYYDWVITAVAPGVCKISQTCEYKNEFGNTAKAMIDIGATVS